MSSISTIVLIVEDRFPPIPPDVSLVQEFGDEMVMGPQGQVLVEGKSMMFKASHQAFWDWLGEQGGIWTSLNPLLGDWRKLPMKPPKD